MIFIPALAARFLRPSFLIYAIGLGVLFLADLIIARTFAHDEIAAWAQFRSLVGIAAVIPLVGLDQVLVRSPASSAQLLRLLGIQVPALGLAVGILMYWFGLVSYWWLGTGLAIGSAASLALFQYFRAHRHEILSQFAQQGWKIAVFGFILIMAFTGWRSDIVVWGVGLLLANALIVALVVLVLPPERMHPQAPQPTRAHYAIGSRFMVTALMLALSVYAEQLIVNRLGSSEEAALYFTTATYFLFPLSFLNGYLAFLMGPWVRDRHDKFCILLRTRWWAIVLGAAGYGVAMNLVGLTLWQVVRPSVGAVDPELVMLLLWTGFARTLYLLPSGYLGVFGMPRQHDMLIIEQICALIPVVGLFLALRACSVDLVHSVAAASALNWSLRASAGFIMIGVVARVRRREAH